MEKDFKIMFITSIQLLLKMIYYPIGITGEVFGFIAGKLEDLRDKLQWIKIKTNG